jgi:hypothetical protein
MRFRVSLLSVLAAASSAGAQNEVVPRQLALSIVHFQNVGTYQYFGQGGGDASLSTDVPASITTVIPTPPRGSVTGSITWPRMSDVFGVAEGSVETVRSWFAEEFKRRGFLVTSDETERARFGGFRDADAGSVGRGSGYCAADNLINADFLPLDQRRVEYRIRVTTAHQNCRSTAPRGRAPGFVDPLDFPILLNPANATQTQASFPQGCAEREFGSGSMGVMLATTMTPAELLKHYDRQMASSGWKQVPIPSSVNSVWSKADANGDESLMVLTASAARMTANCRYVEIRLTRPPARIK